LPGYEAEGIYLPLDTRFGIVGALIASKLVDYASGSCSFAGLQRSSYPRVCVQNQSVTLKRSPREGVKSRKVQHVVEVHRYLESKQQIGKAVVTV
jgi:hypothetical protein